MWDNHEKNKDEGTNCNTEQPSSIISGMDWWWMSAY